MYYTDYCAVVDHFECSFLNTDGAIIKLSHLSIITLKLLKKIYVYKKFSSKNLKKFHLLIIKKTQCSVCSDAQYPLKIQFI